MSTGDEWSPDEPQGTETRDARRARCVPDEPWRMASESRSVTVASMPGSRWPYVFRVTVSAGPLQRSAVRVVHASCRRA